MTWHWLLVFPAIALAELLLLTGLWIYSRRRGAAQAREDGA